MKRLMLVAAILLFAGGTAGTYAHGHLSGVSFGVFYSSLGLHGEWIMVDHDVYAWRPYRVARAWRPYWDGRWVWTDDGWYWVSGEPWAWAVYHYGRWYYDDYYGWLWMPGYEWAPAWVEWRYGPDYVGWAPLGPYAVFRIGVGITYPVAWVTPYAYWTFVPCHAMGHAGIYRYAFPQEANARWFGSTRSLGTVEHDRGRIVVRGPERNFIERHGGVRIERIDVLGVEERGRDRLVRENGVNRIEVYRPRIDRTDTKPERYRRTDRTIGIEADRIDGRYVAPPPDRSQMRGRSEGVEQPQIGKREGTRRPEARTSEEHRIIATGERQSTDRGVRIEAGRLQSDGKGRGVVRADRQAEPRRDPQQIVDRKKNGEEERGRVERRGVR